MVTLAALTGSARRGRVDQRPRRPLWESRAADRRLCCLSRRNGDGCGPIVARRRHVTPLEISRRGQISLATKVCYVNDSSSATS
jgi:hypothetical protein